ncbi:hypothetical protein HZS_5501, partial [Henneguya salminicola]
MLQEKIMSSLSEHFNVICIIHIGISILLTILCILFEIKYQVPGIFYLQIFSLSVSFLIDADYTRRENALIQLAELRSSCVSTFLISKSWRNLLRIDDRVQQWTLIHQLYGMLLGILNISLNSRITTFFERLKVYREYRSPLTQRSFTKILSFFLPILFAPWFAHMSTESGPTWKWLAVLYNALFTFILNGQTFITDRLFDPFLAISNDHIDLSQTLSWIEYAMVKIENRKYIIFNYIPPISCGKAVYEFIDQNLTDNIKKEEYKPFK